LEYSPLPLAGINPVVSQVKQFYEQFSAATIARLDEIYTQDVEFRDPVHTIRGSLRLKGYLRRMATSLSHYRMHYVDEAIGEHSAYLTWEMEYAHARLRGGQIITLRGMTRLHFTNKVFYHEDSYDLGALLYEHIPGLGLATRQIKKHMARQV
jgi:hypothetical protein